MVQKVFRRRQGECNGWCAGGKTIISKLRILQNEVRGVINSDRRLTVREFAEKWEVSKTTVYGILSQDLNMSRVCTQCSKTFH